MSLPESATISTSSEMAPSEIRDKSLEADNVGYAPYTISASVAEFETARKANRLGVPRSDRERFWSKITTTDTCWLWESNLTRGGYGQFCLWHHRDRQHNVYAHRFAYELVHGPIGSTDIKACHHCDNPRCCRPAHIFLGSQADNLADARKKGRLDESLPRLGKLTYADKITILNTPNERGVGVRLARQYGVGKAYISNIRRGRFARPKPGRARV